MRLRYLTILIFLTSFTFTVAQEANLPTIFGYVRTFHESNFETNATRFRIRMARLGIKGNISEELSYRIFVDFARYGTFTANVDTIAGIPVITSATSSFSNILLDAYAAYKLSKNIGIQVGQFKIPFSSDNLLSGASIPFSERPLMAAATPGLRDVGAMGNIKFDIGIPLDFYVGVFNGAGFNKSENDKTTNYSTRIVAKPVKGVSLSANYYGGQFSGKDTYFYNFGAEYKNGSIWTAAEYTVKNVSDVTDKTTNAYFAYLVFDIPTSSEQLTCIQPGVRFDSYDPNNDMTNDDTKRYTAGLTFQFTEKRSSHFRLNYEKYDLANGDTNPDRFVVEFQIKF